MASIAPDSAETESLLQQVRAGDRRAFDQLFARHRPYLCRFVALSLDPKLRARLDPSDLVQEAHLEAVRRLPAYLAQSPMPFRLWLRQIAQDHLRNARRDHVETARRSVQREVPLPDHSAHLLAQQLLASGSTPSQQLHQDELARRLRGALAQLPEVDREILLLRNCEELSYQEASYVLGIEPAAARKRHSRALLRLHQVLFAGGLTESQL
jgi:RNA polymerase sigma-70 factor (ECF subfamily)